MVDKKDAAIAILCVTAILCLGLYSNSAQESLRLKGGMRELEDEYDKLARVRTSLEENYSELRTEKEDLEAEYSRLSSDYSKIESEITSLEKILETGEAIADSAEWISEDECLKGTSEVIVTRELWIWGIYLPEIYTIRVNVTNIGDKPIDKIVIFVFPYKDGKFAETYLEYMSHKVENIYIGETYSHDFTSLPKEMTSYKVLAVVG